MIIDTNCNVDNRLFDFIWNNTTDAIFTIGHDGSIMDANPAFEALIGWKIEELRGLPLPPFFSHLTKKEHQEILYHFREGKNLPYILSKRKHKDGNILDIIASYRSINNQDILAVGMYKNFTEQMKVQHQLEAGRQAYQTLVESLTEAIIVTRKEKVVFVNFAGVKLFGQIRAEDMIGHLIWEFISSEHKVQIKEKINSIFDQINLENPILIKEKFTRNDGNIACVEMKVKLIEYNGKPSMQFLIQDISEKKKYEDQLEYLAFHDPLTELKNRREFSEIIKKSIKNAGEKNEKLAIMYIDLDHFKSINDSLGHETGDELLQQFANRLKSSVRNDDELFRIGGDEFIVLLKNITNCKQIERIAERMHSSFKVPYTINQHTFVVTTSIGISVYPDHGTIESYLISYADQALYKAKETKNQIVFYS